MLWQKLLGTSDTGPLKFVGGAATTAAATQTPSYSLTGLTGGIASAPAAGDLVIACVTFFDTAGRNIQCTTSGYTELADLDNDVQLGIYYKRLSASDTSVAFDLGASLGSRFAVHVWRDSDSTTPIDTTTTTATSLNPPPITTATNKAVVVAVGAWVQTFGASNATSPANMFNFFTARSTQGSGSSGIGIASALVPTAGTFDPDTFVISGAAPNLSATIAIRPA